MVLHALSSVAAPLIRKSDRKAIAMRFFMGKASSPRTPNPLENTTRLRRVPLAGW
jgi:hypothetical protein